MRVVQAAALSVAVLVLCGCDGGEPVCSLDQYDYAVDIGDGGCRANFWCGEAAYSVRCLLTTEAVPYSCVCLEDGVVTGDFDSEDYCTVNADIWAATHTACGWEELLN